MRLRLLDQISGKGQSGVNVWTKIEEKVNPAKSMDQISRLRNQPKITFYRKQILIHDKFEIKNIKSASCGDHHLVMCDALGRVFVTGYECRLLLTNS